MGVRWNGSEEKGQEEGWKEEEVTLVPHLRASLVASKPGVTGDARKTTSLSEEFLSLVLLLLNSGSIFPCRHSFFVSRQ
jgi:hypothetical protein